MSLGGVVRQVIRHRRRLALPTFGGPQRKYRANRQRTIQAPIRVEADGVFPQIIDVMPDHVLYVVFRI
jgi:hypothetical protein